MSDLKKLAVRDLPPPPKFIKLIGPSIILLGLGLGSGEVILWPYLVSNWGLGIIWAAVVGITFQFFLNMEIERYAVVCGESVFVGLARKFRFIPVWFILSTFLGFGWPGIIAASAKIFSSVFKTPHFDWLAIFFLLIIGLILSLGPVLYKTVERFQKVVLSVGIPLIIIISCMVANRLDWAMLAKGIAGVGEGYHFLPASIPLFTFLGALAYAGAGGNLNLAQSFYVKDKRYGMGYYAGRITSLFTEKPEPVTLEGTTFKTTPNNLKNFANWWRLINLEHLLVFWGTGLFTILMLALLAYAATYGSSGNAAGIQFILNQATRVGLITLPFIGTLLLLIAGLTLFGTQFTVMDATSRIISENIILTSPKKIAVKHLPKIYYCVLWFQILFGIGVFLVGFSEPITLITLGAVANAVAMFSYILLIAWLNRKTLPEPVRIPFWRMLILVVGWLFFGILAFFACASLF